MKTDSSAKPLLAAVITHLPESTFNVNPCGWAELQMPSSLADGCRAHLAADLVFCQVCQDQSQLAHQQLLS